MSKSKQITITVQGTTIGIMPRPEGDYISLTDMVRNFDGAGALIEQWLKNKDTILFLGVWERINNPHFNSPEFEGIGNEAGRNSFFLSAKKWIHLTGAKGLIASAGRYGGTYAHKDIAFEFGSWLSPEFKLITEFQRLKEDENSRLKLDWSLHAPSLRSTTASTPTPSKKHSCRRHSPRPKHRSFMPTKPTCSMLLCSARPRSNGAMPIPMPKATSATMRRLSNLSSSQISRASIPSSSAKVWASPSDSLS